MHPAPIYLKWFLVLAWMVSVIAGIVAIYLLATARRPSMHPVLILFFALASAFTWVEVLKWGSVKPFTCTKCMCGWFAMALAFYTHAPYWPLYAVAGVFVGAMYSGIKMRWL